MSADAIRRAGAAATVKAAATATATATAIALALLVAGWASADALDDVLALVPPTATSVIVAPSLAKVSADIDDCLAAMDRKETVVAGRPVDHLRAALSIQEGFNEQGSMAVWTVEELTDGAPTYVFLVPVDDPAGFLKANVERGEDGVERYRGAPMFTRALAKHVLASKSKGAIEGYAAGDGIGTTLAPRMGDASMALARRGDLVFWSAKGVWSGQAMALKGLVDGASDLLVVVDVDTLGLSIRSFGRIEPGTPLAALASSCTAVEGDGAATLKGIHGGPFLFAGAVDLQALGGPAKLADLAALLGAADAMPAWFASATQGMRSLRLAIYPSKLGILAGGVLNDSNVVIETANPTAVRDLLKRSLLEQAGVGDGVRREPTWEDGRTLKDGTVVDAYELKETPLGPSEAGDSDPQVAAMRGLFRQALFGPRGLHGFAKVTPKGLVMTFSQRPDVLARALEAEAGGASMADDPVIESLAPWLVRGAQVSGFVSVGQILKIARQMADAFGGGMDLPSIPTKSPPVAFAFKATPSEVETALMIPTAVLGALYDQAIGQLGGRGGRGRPAAPSPDPSAPVAPTGSAPPASAPPASAPPTP